MKKVSHREKEWIKRTRSVEGEQWPSQSIEMIIRVRFLRFGVQWPMSRKKGKATGSGEEPPPNVFGALDVIGSLPVGPEDSVIPVKTSKRRQKNTSRGRVDIIRQTAHRGGKGVTVAKNFTGIGLPEKQELAKTMRKACGVGGTVKDGCIEIQGDQREKMKLILTEAGFNPVFAGG